MNVRKNKPPLSSEHLNDPVRMLETDWFELFGTKGQVWKENIKGLSCWLFDHKEITHQQRKPRVRISVHPCLFDVINLICSTVLQPPRPTSGGLASTDRLPSANQRNTTCDAFTVRCSADTRDTEERRRRSAWALVLIVDGEFRSLTVVPPVFYWMTARPLMGPDNKALSEDRCLRSIRKTFWFLFTFSLKVPWHATRGGVINGL